MSIIDKIHMRRLKKAEKQLAEAVASLNLRPEAEEAVVKALKTDPDRVVADVEAKVEELLARTWTTDDELMAQNEYIRSRWT